MFNTNSDPENLAKFRAGVYDMLFSGVFDEIGFTRREISEALEEILLLVELGDTPSPCQKIFGLAVLAALEKHYADLDVLIVSDPNEVQNELI